MKCAVGLGARGSGLGPGAWGLGPGAVPPVSSARRPVARITFRALLPRRRAVRGFFQVLICNTWFHVHNSWYSAVFGGAKWCEG
jgi:hypothetical protein